MARWILLGVMPLTLYFLLPLISGLFPSFLRYMFFLNFVRIPFVDYDNLTHYGVYSAGRNFYISGKYGIRIGCWHILPSTLSKSLHNARIPHRDMERMVALNNHPIVVYLHGNSFDRTAPSRTAMYNVLSSLDFHILAIDYRGYGDSNGYPNETGVIEDARETYLYAKSIAGKNQIFIWGHSMGTGVATALAMQLSEKRSPPVGLVLESGFNNLKDEIASHPFSKPFRWLPWFKRMVIDPISRSGLNMSTDIRITRVSCPILIMHAADDNIIPVQLGRRLRDAARNSNRDVTYVEFDAKRNFRHKFIHLARELPNIIRTVMMKLGKLVITACLIPTVINGETYCYVCDGASSTEGNYCNLENVCVGQTCFYELNLLTGTWFANCNNQALSIVHQHLVTECELQLTSIQCRCTFNLCNSISRMQRRFRYFNRTVPFVLPPQLSTTCHECGTFISPDAHAPLKLDCDDKNVCQGSFCLARSGPTSVSSCGTIWNPNYQSCVNKPDFLDICYCGGDYCNHPNQMQPFRSLSRTGILIGAPPADNQQDNGDQEHLKPIEITTEDGHQLDHETIPDTTAAEAPITSSDDSTVGPSTAK